MNLLIYFLGGFSFAVEVYALLNLLVENRSVGISVIGKFMILLVVSMVATLLGLLYTDIYALFIFFLFQFSLIVMLYYLYLKTALYQVIFLPLAVTEEIISALSLYFSIFMTLSFIEGKQLEKKGNVLILTSLVILVVSTLSEIFYFIFISFFYIEISILLFYMFVSLFFSPFVLRVHLADEKEQE